MKLANNVNVRVFCKEEENKDEILGKLKSLLPFDLEKEKITIEETKSEGFDEKIIIVLKVTLSRERLVSAFLKNLSDKLGNEKETLLEQLDSRLDPDLNFFLRLDKEMLLKDKFVLTDSGNCYHIRINVAAFPHNKEKGTAIVKEMFK